MIRIMDTRVSGTLVFGAARDDRPGAAVASLPARWFSLAIGASATEATIVEERQ